MYSGFIEILPSGPVVISNFPYLRFACSRTAGGLILNGALSISNTPVLAAAHSGTETRYRWLMLGSLPTQMVFQAIVLANLVIRYRPLTG
jgi:hypothetical protein